MRITPISIKEANEFVMKVHRHHYKTQGAKFALSLVKDGKLIGVSIVGRPVSRYMDDGFTLEVTRLATDGTKNACSLLYGASWRATKELGYRRIITYTLASEPGTSLRAAGWMQTLVSRGGSWSCVSRPRIDKHPLEQKKRWEQKTSDFIENKKVTKIENEKAQTSFSLLD